MVETKQKIWLSSPHMGGTEQIFVQEAFDTNWVAPLGPNVNAFEGAISNFLGAGVHTAALSSGTAGLHLGLQLLGVGPGDDVLCQSFTFSASVNPIRYLGANPVFIDSEATTWNLSPELLEKAIVDGIQRNKKPKAIVAVHLYGMPFQVAAIRAIADQYAVPILEDSAEALGSTFEGHKCGTFGDIGILSFNGNKIITTSGGGALTTRDKAVKDQAVFLATQARDDAPHYEHSQIGYNYRMSNVLAGIGRGQMEVLSERVEARRANFGTYVQALASVEGLEFLREPKGYFSNRWLSCVLTPSFEVREQLRLALQEDDIESRPLWKPMHMQPIFGHFEAYTDGTSEALFQRGLCLPSGSNLEQQDLERVIAIIKKVMLK